MRLFLDTEFAGFEGELISMALVAEDGREWYQVRQLDDEDGLDPWVIEHVMPKLGTQHSLTNKEFSLSLQAFLSNFDGCEIIADWPADFEHLCAWMTGLGASAGGRLPIECTMRLINSGDITPETPHNALSDARALRDWYLRQG
jgi:hypothetical protein